MDDSTPATKGDLQKLGLSINERFEKIDERFEKMDERFEKMDEKMNNGFQELLEKFDREHEDVDRVLNILVNVKSKTDDHEKRIVRLEKLAA